MTDPINLFIEFKSTEVRFDISSNKFTLIINKKTIGGRKNKYYMSLLPKRYIQKSGRGISINFSIKKEKGHSEES